MRAGTSNMQLRRKSGRHVRYRYTTLENRRTLLTRATPAPRVLDLLTDRDVSASDDGANTLQRPRLEIRTCSSLSTLQRARSSNGVSGEIANKTMGRERTSAACFWLSRGGWEGEKVGKAIGKVEPTRYSFFLQKRTRHNKAVMSSRDHIVFPPMGYARFIPSSAVFN